MIRFLLSLLLITLASMPAAAAKRVALVIGNSNYSGAPKLANPQNDANAIAITLSGLDFEVIKGLI